MLHYNHIMQHNNWLIGAVEGCDLACFSLPALKALPLPAVSHRTPAPADAAAAPGDRD